MTTTTRSDATPARGAARPRVARPTTMSVLALTLFETRRLLRHPALLAALAAYAAQWIHTAATSSDRYPVLHDEARFGQVPLLFLAVGTFLAVHLSVLRPARDGTAEAYSVLVVAPWRRTTAHLLSVLPAAAVAGALAGARIGYLAAQPGAVGGPSVGEMATGPLVVLLAGVLAVCLARFASSVAAGLLVLAALGVLTVAGALNGSARWRWLAPIAFEDEFLPPLPSNLLYRPAGLHLAYLLGVTAALGVLSLLRAGLRGRLVQAALAAALVSVVATAAGQLRPLPNAVATARDTAATEPAAVQECSTIRAVTYCAFPEFIDRRAQWSEVADRILDRLPSSARSGHYFVRQHIDPAVFASGGVVPPAPVNRWAADDQNARTPDAVVAGTEWGQGSDSAHTATIGFAAAFAHRAVAGDPATATAVTKVCGARGVVVLWLAAQATPETKSALRSHASRSYGGLTTFSPLNANVGLVVDRNAVDLALALIDQPTTRTASEIKQSWRTLTDADTSLEQAAEILGGPAPRAAAEGTAPC
ncbi:ABC transporter permease [Streptomyces sp. O3]